MNPREATAGPPAASTDPSAASTDSPAASTDSPAADLVLAAHCAFVAFVVVAPFCDDERLLVAHFLAVPLLWVHWCTNSDACALTQMECALRGVPARESFFHALVAPVYRLPDAGTRRAAWFASAALWALTARRVARRPAMVREVLGLA